MNFYRYTRYILSILFVFVSNFCFAYPHSSKSLKDIGLIDILFYLIIFTSTILVVAYFFVYITYIKRKKTKEFCQKNHLTFTEKSKKLPDNIQFKFVKINAGNNGECIYRNIMQGSKNELSFIMCDFSFKYIIKNGYVESPSFPLFIIKKPNANFPYFFLRRRKDLNDYQMVSYITLTGYNMQKNNAIRSDYKNHIVFYHNKLLDLNEDQQFNTKFDLDVDDEENAKMFFEHKIRKFFIEKALPNYVYEGNGDYFFISTSKVLTFEEMIKFFEESLTFYIELISV